MTQSSEEQSRLADLMDRLSRAVQRAQYAGGLNPAQWEALRYVARANRYSRSPGAVAEYLGTTRGTASQTLKALEHKGCIVRRPMPGDRRGVKIELTKTGAKRLEDDPLNRIGEAIVEAADPIGAMNATLGLVLRRLQQGAGLRDFGTCTDCRRLCRECADPGEAGPHLCGVTGETLTNDEISQICINFEGQPG